MAFHRSVLGKFAGNIFCDEWGYVPQIGDHPRNFDWGRGGKRFSRREWNRIIWECEKKTRIALLKKRGKYRPRRKPQGKSRKA